MMCTPRWGTLSIDCHPSVHPSVSRTVTYAGFSTHFDYLVSDARNVVAADGQKMPKEIAD